MIKVGLTGSIGMGKSTTAQMFADEGIPVYDADREVHLIYEKGGAAVPIVAKLFPSAVVDGKVDRTKLSKLVLNDKEALKKLEAAVHPLVGKRQLEFLENSRKLGADMVVLDIPLLFETNGTERVDVVVVVSAPRHVQRTRVLEREGMSEEKFESILAKQTPDEQKRAGADYIVDTSLGLESAHEQVRKIIAKIRHNASNR